MEILVFRTDIKTKKKVKLIKPVLNQHHHIKDWSVDIEDIDNVLRIETKGLLVEKDVINLVKNYGFYCETLPD